MNMARRNPFRPTLLAAAAAVALLAPPSAQADPITLIAIGANLGFTGTAALVAGAISAYGGYALIALNIYGAVDARRRARAAQREATRRYNASVTDRSTTLLRGTPPWRIVYGECITGGDVLAIFTSDKPVVRNGSVSSKPDGLKHMVIALAAHEVDAIGDIYIDGVSLGTLDGSGYPTGSDWAVPVEPYLSTVTFTNTVTLSRPVTGIVSAVTQGDQLNTFNVDRTVAVSGGGLTLTVTDGLGATPVTVVYTTEGLAPAVIRISKHLGTSSQTVDTYLNSVKPTEWDSSHTLLGVAYIVVTLDLEDPRFQGGPPPLTARVKGKKVYDPRLDSTNGGSGSHRRSTPSTWQWSANPALCVRDWITGEYGMAAAQTDVEDAFTIAAANACDVTFMFTIARLRFTLPTYRCNGVATTEEGREKVLDDLADSMAGLAIYGAQWQIMAGAWTAPVMDLTDDDLDGQIEVVQAGAGIDEVVNGVRGTYIDYDSASPGEFQPYQNATFLAADGADYWQDVALPFTNAQVHCKQIARVLVERGRNGLIISYPAKLRAWPLQLGDRVRVTSAEYGYTTKTFRVTDWQFGLRSPVTLLLQEDAADAYDTIDAVDADPTPNTDLPQPWTVEALSLNTPESGTNHLVQFGDGTVAARVWVSWAALTGAYLRAGQGQVVVRWRRVGADVDWQQATAAADEGGIYLPGVVGGDRVVIEAWARNALGFRGASDTATHTVVGKSAAPADVAGFAATVSKGRVRWAWTPLRELDYQRTEIRGSNSGWGGAGALWSGRVSEWVEIVTAPGTLTRYIRHIDASDNPSASTVSASITVTSADLVQDGISSSLSRSVANFTADSTGVVDASQSFATTMTVLNGTTDDTSNWTIGRTSSDASITTSISGATVTITGIGTILETGTVTVTATRSGYPTQNIVVQVGKTKRAAPNNGPVALAGYLEVVAGTMSPADATAKIQLETDGRITGWVNGTSSNIGNWFLANTSGIGSGYEARFELLDLNNSSTGTTSNALGTWGALSTARYVQIQYTTNSAIATQRQYSFAVRRTSDGAQVCTGQVYMDCSVEV
jgi:hypothetical protein